jgi:hypothetical protein
LLRGKLKVRVILNGNAFHYGRAILAYSPQPADDEFTLNRGLYIQDIVEMSQRPHIFLDPNNAEGGELSLPFIWRYNALSIPRQEWNNMGQCALQTIQPLKHANDADDGVFIQIFAWMEDVQLSIPTSAEPGALSPQCELLDPQSGDEYGQGIVSKTANIVSEMAGMAQSIPSISPYALATKMAASTVSSIAQMFGYSRPVTVAPIMANKPTFLGNIANVNSEDTSTKLALDVKQETTVDPRVTGMAGDDEMSILSISKRQSFLTNIPWSVADGNEALLFSTEVSPVNWSTLNNEIHMPACCFATLPFRFWRGTMKYRFQVVCSSFHKGRLRIVYEPAFYQSAEFNTNYQYIVDISRERDFTVDIGWGQNIGYAAHRIPGFNVPPWSTATYPSNPWPAANGILSVYVLSELTVPNSVVNNDIEINVFISTGDDFEVSFPDSDSLTRLAWFDPTPPDPESASLPAPEIITKLDPQAGVDETYEENNSPIIEEAIHRMAPSVNEDYTPVVYHGDPITSFRTCLKRYNLHSAFSVASDDRVDLRLQTTDFPMYRGRAPFTIHQDSLGLGYNYMNMTLLNYLTPAFNCRRGGLRWKYHFSGFEPENSLALVTRTRYLASTPARGFQQYELPVPDQPSTTRFGRIYSFLKDFPHLWDGAHMTDLALNPVIEVEIPFYQNSRFYQAKFASFGTTTDSYSNVGLHSIFARLKRKEDSSIVISNFVSTAEDFNLTFYLGPPVAYYNPTMPTPLVP